MPFSLPFHFEKNFLVSTSPDKIRSFLIQYQSALVPLFPGLSEFTKVSSDVFFWKFEPLQYAGKELSISFYTQFLDLSDEVKVLPSSEKAALTQNELKGSWKWTKRGEQTEVRLYFDLTLSVPLPSITKSVVSPIAITELTKLFERYVNNLKSALE